MSSAVIKIGELPMGLRKRLGCSGREEGERVRISVDEIDEQEDAGHQEVSALRARKIRRPVKGGMPRRVLTEAERREREAALARIKATKAPVDMSAEEIIRIVRDEDFI